MSDDLYSLPNRIERAEQRIARQREIVAELGRYNSAQSAQNLLTLMEESLASLREMQRDASHLPAQARDAGSPA
jgi:hypothetical protein